LARVLGDRGRAEDGIHERLPCVAVVAEGVAEDEEVAELGTVIRFAARMQTTVRLRHACMCDR
jgi:hypothetical protein